MNATTTIDFKKTTCKFSTLVVCSFDRIHSIAAQLEEKIANSVNSKVQFTSAWEAKTPCGLNGFYLAFDWRGKGLCSTKGFLPEEHISNFAEYDPLCNAYFYYKWNAFAGRPGAFYAAKKGTEDKSTCGNWTRNGATNLCLDLDRGFAPGVDIPCKWDINTLEISERASYRIQCHGTDMYAIVKASAKWICREGYTGKIQLQTDICDRTVKSGYQTVDRVTVSKSPNCLIHIQLTDNA